MGDQEATSLNLFYTKGLLWTRVSDPSELVQSQLDLKVLSTALNGLNSIV